MRTHWLLILAISSATTAWPWKPTAAVSQGLVVRENEQLYVRDTTTASTTTTAADTTTTAPTTTSTTSASTSTSTSTTSTSTSTSTTSTTSTSTTSATTATSTTASSTTTSTSTSTTATTSSASSTSTASSTTSTTSTTTSSSTSSSTTTLSASAAAKLAAWNHAGEIRAIVVFSILGGVALGFTFYSLVTECIRRKQTKQMNRLSTAGSSYSIIPLTAEGKDDARTLRESRMFL